jgi:hypothetical protein
VIYRSGDFVYYYDDDGHRKLGRLRAILKNDDGDYQLRVQKILNYNDLPRNLKGFTGRKMIYRVPDMCLISTRYV